MSKITRPERPKSPVPTPPEVQRRPLPLNPLEKAEAERKVKEDRERQSKNNKVPPPRPSRPAKTPPPTDMPPPYTAAMEAARIDREKEAQQDAAKWKDTNPFKKVVLDKNIKEQQTKANVIPERPSKPAPKININSQGEVAPQRPTTPPPTGMPPPLPTRGINDELPLVPPQMKAAELEKSSKEKELAKVKTKQSTKHYDYNPSKKGYTRKTLGFIGTQAVTLAKPFANALDPVGKAILGKENNKKLRQAVKDVRTGLDAINNSGSRPIRETIKQSGKFVEAAAKPLQGPLNKIGKEILGQQRNNQLKKEASKVMSDVKEGLNKIYESNSPYKETVEQSVKFAAGTTALTLRVGKKAIMQMVNTFRDKTLNSNHQKGSTFSPDNTPSPSKTKSKSQGKGGGIAK